MMKNKLWDNFYKRPICVYEKYAIYMLIRYFKNRGYHIIINKDPYRFGIIIIIRDAISEFMFNIDTTMSFNKITRMVLKKINTHYEKEI